MLAAEDECLFGIGGGGGGEFTLAGEVNGRSVGPSVLEFGFEAIPIGEELHVC